MKPGRNEPCPCGSGKKYKKCCLKEQSTAAGDRITSEVLQDDDLFDLFEDPELLIRFMNNFRRITLDKKPHIKEYYKIRKMHSVIVDAMIQYHDDGKFKQKTDTDLVRQDAHNPALYLLKSEFDMETNEGAQGYYDVVIYKSDPNTSCITEDFIQGHRYRKPEKIEFLYSMLDSKPGLFEIVDTDSSEGFAYLKDVFTGAEYKIIDVGLSGDQKYDEFYVYTRIINYHDISFGTGLNLVFTKTDSFIKDHIQHHKKDYSPIGEFMRFTQLYNHYSKCSDKVRVVANAWE